MQTLSERNLAIAIERSTHMLIKVAMNKQFISKTNWPHGVQPKALLLSCKLMLALVGARVQRVLPEKDGSSAQVQLEGGQTVTAAKGVVVAVEGPEAWRLLGEAMDVSSQLK